jgi:hypothetical protein
MCCANEYARKSITTFLAYLDILVLGISITQWHPLLPIDTAAELATWASIYGFLISCVGLAFSAYAALGVRQIRLRFLAKARLPELSRKLQKDASALSDLAAVSPVPQLEKTRLFSSLHANLDALKRHLPYNLRRRRTDAKKLVLRLAREAETNISFECLGQLQPFWPAYEKIQLLKHEIDHHLADEKWES